MPTYEYEHIDQENLQCDDPFDVIQSVSEDSLTVCPTCGKPVRKVFGRVGFIMATDVSPDAAAKKGFTTYRKTGKGTYEKAGGEGPNTISAGDD